MANVKKSETNPFEKKVQREGLKNGFYGYLSLSHQVGNPPKPIGKKRVT